MAEERVQRRLAAILAADVVGYSRLMEQDESGTLIALKARRKEVLEPLVARHQGRIFKVTGDGVLIEFGSAVDAVQCAVKLQDGMAVENGDLPEARRIVLRIGVNLCDVMIEGGDRYGDGVNIAARLEQLAEPGGILVSGTTYDHARNKVEAGFEDLGTQTLKNIAEPVRAYRVTGTPRVALAAPKGTTDKPSIAVLPFVNMSGDPEQQYFSDGITEDIITELSRWHQLWVLSRNSSFQYRGKTVDVKRVARELGVQYVVEGSVRRVGEQIRVTTQLVNAVSGNHLWAERYDRNAEEIFAIQDEVVRTIVGTLVGRVQAAAAELAKRKPPNSLAAYECVLRGRALPWGDPQADAEARRLYEKAIEIDSDYGLAHALLALMLQSEWSEDISGSDALLDQAFELAKKAVDLDENESFCQFMVGNVHLYRRSFELAEQYHRRALEMNPSNPEDVANMGVLLVYLGRSNEGLEWLRQARRVDPYFGPQWYWHMLGHAYMTARQYDEAITAFERSTTKPPWVHAYIAACHAQAGRTVRARECVVEALRLQPTLSIKHVPPKEPFKYAADLANLVDGLRNAGLPE